MPFRKAAPSIEMPHLSKEMEEMVMRARRLVAKNGDQPPAIITKVSVAGDFNGWELSGISQALKLVCDLAKTE